MGSLAGTIRIVLGVLLIIVGIFGLFIFFIGIIPIILGALLIWSGRGASRQEEMNRQLQIQQNQLAYMQGRQAMSGPAAPPGYGYGTPMGAPPAPAPPPGAPCPRCGQATTWIAQYGRWYCYRDQQYV